MTLELWLGVVGLVLAVLGLAFNRKADAVLEEIRSQVALLKRILCGPPPPT